MERQFSYLQYTREIMDAENTILVTKDSKRFNMVWPPSANSNRWPIVVFYWTHKKSSKIKGSSKERLIG